MAKLISTVFIIGIIFYSIILHEVSHGLVAYWLGDDTAKRHRRLSFNPMSHIDWFGTVILPLLLYFTAGFTMGYAKPVPINPYNFRNWKRDSGLTALAGPVTNILIAIFFALIYHISGTIPLVAYIATQVVVINLVLAIFNLVPIPPLDGSKVIGMALPDDVYMRYTAQERLGFIVLFGLIIVSNMLHLDILSRVIEPPLIFLLGLLGIH